MAGADRADRFEAIHAWHLEVDQRDVGQCAVVQRNRFLPVAGFDNLRHVGMRAQRGGDAGAHHGMVVGDKDAHAALMALRAC